MRVSGKKIGFTIGALALVGALAGGLGIAGVQHVNAQGGPGGPGGRFGGPGGPGGPGMGRRGPGGPGGPGGAMGPGGPGMLALGRLDLTQDQRDRVKQIFDSHKDEQKAIGDRARAAHDALADVVSGGTFDEALIRTRAEAVAAVDVDQMIAQARINSEIYQILTADQQSKLKAMQTERKSRREGLKAERDKKAGV